MHAIRHKPRRDSGFSIVEVMVGVFLVLVGALIFVTAFPAAGRARAAAEQNAIALAAGERQIETMRNMPFDSIDTDYFEAPELRGGYGIVEVSDVEGDANLKLVEVHVYWYQGDDPREVTLSTYAAEH